MAELLDLTAPVTTPNITTFRVIHLVLDMGANPFITIVLQGSDNSTREFGYTGPQAVTLMGVLNKSDLSVKSLQRRILEKLATDFPVLAGTVSGTPD